MQRADEYFIRGTAETLAAKFYPEFIPDLSKEVELLRRADYARVIGEVGKPHSALVALIGNNVWATKRHASVLLWYGEGGGGLRLLLNFKHWVTEQNILVGAVTDDYGMDEDTKRILAATGFEQRGGAHMYFPRKR